MESLFEHVLKWKPEDFERQMKINAIISEPWHGIEFYDPLMLNDLHRLLMELYEKCGISNIRSDYTCK